MRQQFYPKGCLALLLSKNGQSPVVDVGPIRDELKRFNLEWGGLAEFSGNVGDIVARVVSRMEQQQGTQYAAEQ